MQKNPMNAEKNPLNHFRHPMNGGFTLAELLVAVVAASVVSLAALQLYAGYHKLYLQLYVGYQKETAAILDELRRLNPYVSGARRNR